MVVRTSQLKPEISNKVHWVQLSHKASSDYYHTVLLSCLVRPIGSTERVTKQAALDETPTFQSFIP